MEKGKTIEYWWSSDSDGWFWNGSIRCKVKDEVRVKAQSGEFDTYRIVCRVGNITLESYMSPDTKMIVMQEQKDRSRLNPEWVTELVKFNPGTSE